MDLQLQKMDTFEVLIFWQGFNLNFKTFKKKKKDPESEKVFRVIL